MDCGGCHYQHIPYEKQLEWKTRILVDQFQRIAGLNSPPVQAIHPSPGPVELPECHSVPPGLAGKTRFSGFQFTPGGLHPRMPPSHRFPVFSFSTTGFEPLENIERVELRAGLDDDVMMVIKGDDFDLPEVELDIPISIVHEGKMIQWYWRATVPSKCLYWTDSFRYRLHHFSR